MDPRDSLCTKDPRHPVFDLVYGCDEEKPIPRENCYCDNCYSGKDALAMEIIHLRNLLCEIKRLADTP